MHRRVFVAAVLFVTAHAGADVVFSDADFAPSNWGFEVVQTGSGGISAASQILGEGNPAPARRARNTMNVGIGSVYGFSRFGTTNASRYEPATSGAIASIDFSIQHRFSAGLGQTGHALYVGAKQGQTVFVAGLINTGSSTSWTTRQLVGLTASDFASLTGGQTIDFSAGGAPLRFGFVVGSTSAGVGFFDEVDYDNFMVRVVQVPAPSAGCVLAAWAVLATRRRR